MSECKAAKELQDRALKGSMGGVANASSSLLGNHSGRYNPDRWATRGIVSATNLIEETSPLPDESVEQYGKRLLEKLKELKKEYYEDPDDEDGFAAGAVASYVFAVEAILK